MYWLSWALVVLIVGGLGGLAVRKDNIARLVGVGGCVFGCGLGVYGAVLCLLDRRYESQIQNWNVPFASLNVGIDGLTACFLVPTLAAAAMAGLYALKQNAGNYAQNRPREHWLFFNLTLASILLVLISRNAFLFLFAWEVMTVTSFLLVENDQRDPSRKGGWVYLTAGHLSAACLLAMFALLGAGGDSLDFSALGAGGLAASVVFVLACAGFGGKAGLFPFHAWYTESYPQSPPQVGALLSGAVGGMGMYGILRTLDILASGTIPPLWWGFVLTLAGLAGACSGALRSLGAKDISRFLAWSSVENYGLAATGIGFGLLGSSIGHPVLSLLGFSAAILHLANHSFSKTLLFLAAGNVMSRSGTRMFDRLGGLIHYLPLTGCLFLVGGLGASAIPPLNGFVGEFLLLLAAFDTAVSPAVPASATVLVFVAIAAIALTGGVAAAALAKGFGFIFLGTPRQALPKLAVKERRSQIIPPFVLAAACLAMAVLSQEALGLIKPTAERLVRIWQPSGFRLEEMEIWALKNPMGYVSGAAKGTLLLLAVIAISWLIRRVVSIGKKVEQAPTWDCGYADPKSSMQYTATSFVRPLSKTFQALSPIEEKSEHPAGLFPGKSSFVSSPPPVERAVGYARLFRLVSAVAAKVRQMQTGQVQTYLLYMAVVLVLLLIWKL